MAGYSRLYVVGGLGGFGGTDGVNPIEFLVLLGDADRQWLEPRYFDTTIDPIGRITMLVPSQPNDPNMLLDACIAFCPRHFTTCPSLDEVRLALVDTDRLDFHLHGERIPDKWFSLREEARPILAMMNIWQADLVPVE